MSSISRRKFVQGAAGGVGLLSVGGGLRYLEHAGTATAGDVVGQEAVFRTGHSNNCDGACGHQVKVVDGRIRLITSAAFTAKTISGDAAPKFDPRICLRGVAQIQNTYSPDRIKYPYKRVGERGSGKWERISWAEATTTIAEKFKEIQAKHGKKSLWVAPYTGSLSILEGVVGAGFRFASAVGASAGDFEGDNEGDSATPAGWNYLLADPDATAGGIFDGHEMTDFLNAKVIVLWANNVAETSLPDWRIVADAKKNGTTIVSIDPRFTPTSARSDVWLPIRPGTDTALVDGIINYVIQHKLYDEKYVKTYTVAPFLVDPETKKFLRQGKSYLVVDAADGQLKPVEKASDPDLFGKHAGASSALKLLADEMEQYTPEKVASMTDIPTRQVLQLAELWTKEGPIAVRSGFALSHLGAWRPDDAGAPDVAGADRKHRGSRRRRHHLRRRADDDGVRPRQLVGAEGHGDVHRARADGSVRRDAPRQALPRARRLVHGRQLRAADVRPEQGRQGAQVARLRRRLRLRHVGYGRPRGHRPPRVHVPREDRPPLVEQLLPAVHAEGDRAAVGVEVRPRGNHAGRPEDGRRQVLRAERRRVSEGDPSHRRPEGRRERGGPHLGAAHDKRAAPEHADCPVRAVLRQEIPDEVGSDRVLRRAVDPVRPAASGVQGAARGVEIESALRQVSADLPVDAYAVQDALAVREPAVAERDQQRRPGVPRDQPDRREGARDLRRRRRQGLQRPRRPEGERPPDRGHQARRRQLLPGRLGHGEGEHYIEGHPNNLTHQIANPAQSVIPNFRSNAAYYDCLVEVQREGA